MDIYTIGFTHKSASEFFETLKSKRIERLLDVRLSNTSQLAGFTKQADLEYFLEQICSAAYEHEPQLAPHRKSSSAPTARKVEAGQPSPAATSSCSRPAKSNPRSPNQVSENAQSCYAAKPLPNTATAASPSSICRSTGPRSRFTTSSRIARTSPPNARKPLQGAASRITRDTRSG
jgi:hypothetical protein